MIDGTTVMPGDMVFRVSSSAMGADCRVEIRECEPGGELAVSQIDADQAEIAGISMSVTVHEGDKTLIGPTDRTSTVSLNEMHIQKHNYVYSPGETQYPSPCLAAIVTRWLEPARDALDKLVVGSETDPDRVNPKPMGCIHQPDYLSFGPVIKRTKGTGKDKSNTSEGGDTFNTRPETNRNHRTRSLTR